MEKIVYKNGTGIAVITPTIGDKKVKIDNEIVTMSAMDCALRSVPKGAEYKIIDESELPKDRIFRNAWNYDLKEDIPKAKEIWKEKLRVDRKPLLEAQDIAFMQALEKGNDTAAIITEKQRLRDIPQLVDSCKTIASIKKIPV